METKSGDGAKEQISRRRALRRGGAALTALVGSLAAAAGLAPGEENRPQKLKRLTLAIDLSRCTGCMACAVSCKTENGVRLGGFRTWVAEKEIGQYPSVKRHFLPALCNHCQDPPCLRVCPTGATHKRLEGIVDIDKDRCIGCRHCMGACPYNARYFNPRHDPIGEKQFPALTHGTVDKCDLCAHRVDNGVVPACVNTCPMNARIFGDLNDPESEVARLYGDETATTMLPEYGTYPSVFYVRGDPNIFRNEDD
jgi:tetrathionate reductase subunit B